MNLNLQNIAFGAIIMGIVIAFITVILGEVIGRPVNGDTKLYIFGLFTSLATAAVTWLAANQAQKNNAANAEMFRRQNTLIESLQAKQNEKSIAES